MTWSKFFLTLGAFVLTAFAIDRLYAPIPTWADHMLQQYAKKKDSVGVILIGNSHTGAIRDRQIGGLPVMNLSVAGIELGDRLTLLNEVLKSKGSLRYVIMSMDYDQIGHKTSDQRVGNMLLPYSIENDKSLGGYLKRINTNNFLRHNRDFGVLRQYWSGGIDFDKEVNFIPVGFRNKADAEACRKRALELSTLSFSEGRINRNLEIALEISRNLTAHGVQLVLLNTPKTKCLTESYTGQFKQAYRERLAGFASTHRIPFLDFQGDPRFSDEDFIDFDHLNAAGTAKLCSLIAPALGQ
ncbi:MAG: hypothetical protein JWP27_377 [Flaviaesturariibacter sp.]|nr:hypothetical protein [Flaviaesturariibacter sp.]